jgi:hypothetical protein
MLETEPMSEKRYAIDLHLSITAADLEDPKITAALHNMLAALEPLLSAADLEELQEAVELALIRKRIEEIDGKPQHQHRRKEVDA